VTFDDPNQAAAAASFTVPGTYVLQLSAYDGALTTTATITITVNANPNIPTGWLLNPMDGSTVSGEVPITLIPVPPVAYPVADELIPRGATVHLDGKWSISPGGRPLTYRWSFLSVPEGSKALLSGADTPRPTFVADEAGNYSVQLIVSDGQTDSSPSNLRIFADSVPPNEWTLSKPDSLLLFGNPYHDLRLVNSTHVQLLRPQYLTTQFSSPSLARNSALVAWASKIRDASLRVAPVAEKRKDPYDLPIPEQPALAIFSVAENIWKTYPVGPPRFRIGEPFREVSATAVSPNGSKVAFCGGRGAQILDVATGNFSTIFPPGCGSVDFSPDGSHIVVSRIIAGPSGDDGGTLSIIDVGSGAVRAIGRGTDPAWSPTGEWIAYLNGRYECMLLRPDGTGRRTVKNIQPMLGKTGGIAYRPVWSPDGKQLLLNVLAAEADYDVYLVDVGSGRITREKKGSSLVFGWTSSRGTAW
jgi:hypothetical protein